MSEQGMERAEQRVREHYGPTVRWIEGGASFPYSGVNYHNGETMVHLGPTWEDAASRLEPAPAQMTDDQADAIKCANCGMTRDSHRQTNLALRCPNDRFGVFESVADARRRLASTGAETDWDERYRTMPPAKCACGQQDIPAALDGVQWYWQRHARTGCTLELPNERCWCGLLRSEHIAGHAPQQSPAQEQGAVLLPCGHLPSSMVCSVETGEELFCGQCDRAQMIADRVTEEFLREKEQQISTLRAERDEALRELAEERESAAYMEGARDDAQAARDSYKAALEPIAREDMDRDTDYYPVALAMKNLARAALSRDDAGAGKEAKA